MKINIERIDGNFKMSARNETGNEIMLDGSKDIGGAEAGFRPMQLLLAAVGGCSSIDVLLILKKQKQQVEHFNVEVLSEKVKVESHSEFKEILLHFQFKGNVEAEKAKKAIEISLEKYCSVSKALEAKSKINYQLSINDNKIV